MKKIAILIEKDYEDLEYWYPKLRMQEAGYDVATVHAGGTGTFKSKHGYEANADLAADKAKPEDFAAVIIPGGWAPDRMRTHESMVNFVRAMNKNGRVIAAVCHGGSMLVSAQVAEGKTCTSYKSIKDDLVAAGAEWVDREVVVSGNLITSRVPSDLPAFTKAILENIK